MDDLRIMHKFLEVLLGRSEIGLNKLREISEPDNQVKPSSPWEHKDTMFRVTSLKNRFSKEYNDDASGGYR